jgi:diguanylate cyclase (GGDEF)-like protein
MHRGAGVVQYVFSGRSRARPGSRVGPPATGGGTPRPADGSRFFIAVGVLFGILALVVVAYVFVPLPEVLRKVLYDGVGAGSVLLGFAGLRRHRPQIWSGWFLVLIGYAGWVVGDLVWTLEQFALPDQYPAPSDAFYLASYVVLGAGALTFVRSRNSERDLAAVLDALIITTGVGMLVGAFLIAPLANDSSLSVAAVIVSSAYPMGDLFLVGVIVRIYAAPGARTVSYRLLSASFIVTLGADLAYDVMSLHSGGVASSRWTDGVWLIAYLLAGSAACVPSMKIFVEAMPTRPEAALTRGRLAALSGGLMLPGIALLLDGATGGGVHWTLIGVATLLLSTLMLVRMVGLLNVVRTQSVRLTALARSDYLTGAPNRRTWDQELARACALSQQRGSTLAVAMLDLDHFKVFNDTHGHPAGDVLLREAVTAWTLALPAGAILARYGGEEFAVMVPDADAHELATILHRLLVVTPGRQTFSAGVAIWDEQSEPASAVAAADVALYAAKRAGRNRILVNVQNSLASVSAPDQVFPAFTMVTQPIVDLNTFLVSGHEALARFTAPEAGGNVEEVFRRAHVAGFGDLLELEAIQAALELPDRPEGHDLFVNVSARALTSGRFLAGLPNHLNGIIFELSEDPGDVPPSAVADAIAELRARGARIALDDIGAGAQEFARLATLCPDVIKVDRTLVDGCADNPGGQAAVLRSLVAYANHLGLTVCAEGVEDIRDLQYLVSLGITHAQGYLLARPGPGWQQSAVTVGNLADPQQVQGSSAGR